MTDVLGAVVDVRSPETEPVLRLAADTPGEIVDRLGYLAAQPRHLADQLGRPGVPGEREGPCRLAIVAPTPNRLATARGVVVRGTRWHGRGDVWYSPAPLLGAGGGATAFLFPGLEADFRPRVDDVADWLGLPAPSFHVDTLGHRARSALDAGRLLAHAVRRLGIVPDALAGHSVGEWNAMVAGGIFAQDDFDALLRATDLDRLLVPGVDYAVLGCPAERVEALLRNRSDVVLSHENAAHQSVVCGPPEAVGELMGLLRPAGVICRRLPFRSGFHTPMLEPFLAPFATGVPALPVHDARVPVWSATTTQVFPADPEAVRELCVRHLLEPVRFRGLLLALHQAGVRAFIQVGAGQLAGLVDDTLSGLDHATFTANAPHRTGLAQLLRLRVGLWAEGRPEPVSEVFEPADSTGTGAREAVSPPGSGASRTRITATAPATVPAPATPQPVRSAPPVPPDPVAAIERLAALGGSDPLAAELGLLMTEVAGAVVAVVAAATAAAGDEAEPAMDRPIRLRPEPLDTVLPVSTATTPYLLDHCLAAQRPGWPDEGDRSPVVPAATMLTHLAAAAELAGLGRRAVELADVRFHRWLDAAPPVAVDVRVRPLDADRVRVALGDYAEGVVTLGGRYPAGGSAGPRHDDPFEGPPALSARQLYEQRWMFHGPAFQTVTDILGVGPRGIRAVLRPTDAPGSLLDGAGQVLGQWLIEHHPVDWIAFPAAIDRVTFHAPAPAAGVRVECAAGITDVTQDALTADLRLTGADGSALVTVAGWRDRRFAGGMRAGAVHRFAEYNTLAEQQPQGWYLLIEPWPDLASREFHLRKYLSEPERADYRRLAPTAQRSWLLRRIVVKDAARGWLWDNGHGPLFPAEVEVIEGPDRELAVRGRHGRRIPALAVSADADREVGVALVRPSAGGDPARIQVAEGPGPAAPGCPHSCPVTGPGGSVHTVSWT